MFKDLISEAAKALGSSTEKRHGKRGPFVTNIEGATIANTDYRRVLVTNQHSQLVLMSVAPDDELGEEVHPHTDQFIRIEKGEGRCVLNGKSYPISDGTAITVPAGTRHNVINSSKTSPMKLYTVYSPPHHPANRLQKTKPLND